MIGFFIFLAVFLFLGVYATITSKSKFTVNNVLVKSVLCLLYVLNGILFIGYAGCALVLKVPHTIVENLADTETQLEREIKSRET